MVIRKRGYMKNMTSRKKILPGCLAMVLAMIGDYLLGTCGNSDRCDYCVVGSDNPLVEEYEIVTDKLGFLVSRKKAGSRSRTERTVQ